MSTVSWIFWYVADVLFWTWIIFWGGAKLLEGTWVSGCLLSIFPIDWDADGIKAFAWLSLFVSSVYFILGLIKPELRGH
jgi:hypothetical protein